MSIPTEKQRISTQLNHEIRQLRAAYAVLRSVEASAEILKEIDKHIRCRGGESEAARRERWDQYINSSVYPDKCGKPFGGDKIELTKAKDLRAVYIRHRFGI